MANDYNDCKLSETIGHDSGKDQKTEQLLEVVVLFIFSCC